MAGSVCKRWPNHKSVGVVQYDLPSLAILAALFSLAVFVVGMFDVRLAIIRLGQ
jgi:hypothetical protein